MTNREALDKEIFRLFYLTSPLISPRMHLGWVQFNLRQRAGPESGMVQPFCSG
jgi:hypothetical protein